MRFTQITNVREDETADFSIELDRKYTVSTFLNEILKKKHEWGRLLVNDWTGKKICSFQYGKQLSDIPEDYKDLEITKVTASGGWSMMDYYIKF